MTTIQAWKCYIRIVIEEHYWNDDRGMFEDWSGEVKP
jgi:hypothetical protein